MQRNIFPLLEVIASRKSLALQSRDCTDVKEGFHVMKQSCKFVKKGVAYCLTKEYFPIESDILVVL